MKRIAAYLALCIVATSLLAQRNGESVQVSLIEVPVTVVDANGQPVTGLTAANFEIYDDGKKREITHFDAIDLGTRTRIAAAAEPQQQTAVQRPYMRNFMLLFDVSDSSPATLHRAREAALQFVSEQVQPVDRVAVGTVSVQGGFQLLANFTLDREFLRGTIATLGNPKQFAHRDPLLLSVGDYEFMAQAAKTAPGAVESKGRGGEAGQNFEDLSRELKKNVREEQRQSAIRRFDNFAALGQVLDRIAGRKQVILLSEGFDAKAVQGRELLNNAEAQKERTFVERGEIWNVDSDARYGSSDALNALQRMVETLRRADVVLHALDIKGLRNALDEEGRQVTSTESLSLLTRDTGGSVFKNSNDISANLARMLAQQDVTYILGFQTAGTPSGKFHNLRVKLVNVPAAARVTHRLGYYEQSRATIDLDRTLTAGEILMNGIAVSDVQVRAFAAAYPRKSGAAQAPVVLEVEGRSLLEGARGNDVPTDFFIYAFDDKDVVRDFAHQRVTFDLGKLRTKLEAKGVKYYSTLLLPPGNFDVRVLVRTIDGRSGFTSVRVHVPGAGEPVAEPVVFDETPGWVMVKANDRAASPIYPFVAGDTTFVPAARATLAANAPSTLAVMTYNVPSEKVRVDAALEANGAKQPLALSFLGRTAPDADGGVKLMYEVKRPQLAAGTYRLYVTARAGENAAERTLALPFAVE